MNTSKRRGGDASVGAESLRSEPAMDGDSGRDARGRFGPGNPFARRVARLRQVLLDAVSDEDLQIVAEQLVVKAKMGDLAATKLLFQYVLGKPAATVDPDALDVEEVELYQRAPRHGEVTDVVAGRMSAELAAGMLRQVVPVTGLQHAAPIGEAINNAFPEDAEDSDEEEDEEDEEGFGEEQGGEAVMSNSAKVSGDERRSATRPITNGQFPRGKLHTAAPGNGDNQSESVPARSRERRKRRGT
jgi:hypothetical protein